MRLAYKKAQCLLPECTKGIHAFIPLYFWVPTVRRSKGEKHFGINPCLFSSNESRPHLLLLLAKAGRAGTSSWGAAKLVRGCQTQSFFLKRPPGKSNGTIAQKHVYTYTRFMYLQCMPHVHLNDLWTNTCIIVNRRGTCFWDAQPRAMKCERGASELRNETKRKPHPQIYYFRASASQHVYFLLCRMACSRPQQC